MDRKTAILFVVLSFGSVIATGLFYGLCTSPVNDVKGGWWANSPWSVECEKVEISYNDKEIELADKDKDAFILYMKWIIHVGKEIEKVENVDYDVIIDFQNDNIAYVSSQTGMVSFRDYYYEVSDHDLQKIMKYIK
ncbi:hypothetical protein SAMN02745111_00004 [Eubacterium uniforme]|uniref:Uncharacterized protein n=1 Tax=Eubacterium uniforme TaxID=39495 RepID=A0A1T4V4G9_9FIRM|nr:hypothetical protein [Eubacterium uniforme]SKA59481.1 hypothetical protein SAMN02745111_00004 [Eubacterium uniforme]